MQHTHTNVLLNLQKELVDELSLEALDRGQLEEVVQQEGVRV